MLQIKGTLGVGGGHVLRTALTLAALTRREVEIVDFHGPDNAPGLRPRHLAAIQAVAEVCGGKVDGATLNSKRLVFSPGAPRSGDFVFEAARGASGEAGPTATILETVLPILMLSGGPSTVEVHGITHAPNAATVTELQTVFAPTLRKLGFKGEMGVSKWAFAPDGDGVLRARIDPIPVIRAADLTERGPMLQIGGITVATGSEALNVERLKNRALRRIAEVGRTAQIVPQTVPSDGNGSFLFLLVVFERTIAGFAGVGAKGEAVEAVADRAVDAMFAFFQTYAVLERTLAERLLLHAALAEGKSILSVQEISPRMMTTIEILKRFVPVRVDLSGKPGESGEVTVTGIGLHR